MLRNALKDLVTLNTAPLPWPRGLRFMLAIGLPILIGFVMGAAALGVVASMCAFLVSQNDLGGSLRSRLNAMAATLLCIVIGGVAGASTDRNYWLPFIAVFLCGYSVGRLHSTSMVMENMARFFAVALIAASTLHFSQPTLLPLALAGGIGAIAIVALDYALRRHSPADLRGNWRAGLARFRAGQAASIRFAICYAATTTVALAWAEAYSAERAGWVAITTILVMRPDGAESLQLILQRMLGTLLGITIAGALFRWLDSSWALLIGIWSIAFALPLGSARHRWLGIGAATALVMMLIDLSLFENGGARELLEVRIIDTAVGGVLALLGTLLASPRWRTTPVSATDVGNES
ncbi:MAG: FUSC family protein [Steroidobacteraceae bacterium]